MLTNVPRWIWKATTLLHAIVVVPLILSCGRTHASPATVPIDVLMSAVHGYGGGHVGLLSLPSSAKPDETEGVYQSHIISTLVQGDFAQLEKTAAQNRIEKGRLVGGFFKSFEFFAATANPSSDSDVAYVERVALLKKWIAEFPESSAARISLAGARATQRGHFFRARLLPFLSTLC